MLYLKSLIFNVLHYSVLILTALLMSILGPVLSQKKVCAVWNNHSQNISRWLLKHICHIEIEIRGKENIVGRNCVYACKHQSAMETFFLTSIVQNGVFVMKKGLIYVPVIGWAAHFFGMITVDRKAGGMALKKMHEEAKKALQNGRNIIIFPEGTRTKPYSHNRYKPGIFSMYQDLGVEVVPVAINSGFCWQKNSFLRRSGKIIFDFMPKMPQNMKKEEFMHLLEEKIEGRCLELNKETEQHYPNLRGLFN